VGTAPDPTDDSPSRAELLAQIQGLLDKNTRFETRFRDVVSAYKSLLKENEALKSTVAALTGGLEPGAEGSDAGGQGEEPDDGAGPAASPADAAAGGDAEEGTSGGIVPLPSSTIADLQRQLRALKTAVRTITEEKANITGQFQQDKKAVADAHRAALAQQQEAHAGQLAAAAMLLTQQQEEKALLAVQLEALTQQVLEGEIAIHLTCHLRHLHALTVNLQAQ